MKRAAPAPHRPWVLLNPGPVNVTERVRRALLKPDICHREEEFATLLQDVRRKLLGLFGIASTHTVAMITGSGTAALESMLCSFAGEDRPILVLSNGVYGERIKTILDTYRAPVRFLSASIGKFPSLSEIERVLKEDKQIHAVAMVHHETSSGMLNPLAAVAALAKKHGKLFLVDAVSSLGGEEIDLKNIDLCAGTSGKCLHGFPGVSFVILSKKAAAEIKSRKPRSFFLDLANALAMAERGDTAFTPAVQIFYAFREALDELAEEGLKARIRNYRKKSALIQKSAERLGLKFLVAKDARSHVLTAIWTPDHISYEDMHDRLKKKGFVIYAGQSKLKGRIFRISNLGSVSERDLSEFFAHLGGILGRNGKK